MDILNVSFEYSFLQCFRLEIGGEGSLLEVARGCKGMGWHAKKQPPELFCKKRSSYKFRKIHRKTPVPESLFSLFYVFLWILRNYWKNLFYRTPFKKQIQKQLREVFYKNSCSYTEKFFFQSISWNTNLTLISQCILRLNSN